ncbi:MAG: glycoside hydrolase family 18 protein [Bacteroidota bacterium]
MNFKKFLIIVAVITSAWQCNYNNKNARTENEEKKIDKKYMTVGYIAGYRDFDFSRIQSNKLTHINYAFANIIDGKVRFGGKTANNESELKEGDIRSLHDLKKINPYLKILVSVGGWTWSGNFSDVALTDSSRKVFAKSAVDFLLKYKLDGIDLDWEYPNQIGAGNTHRTEDIENFTLLLKEVKEHLDKQSKADNKTGDDKYLLTIASGGDKAYIENTNLGEAHQYLDFINIMTYDAYNGLHKTTGHHANLSLADGDPAVKAKGEELKSALTSVQGHIDAGVPVEKINLGLAFYGRVWKGVKNENNGLFQPAETVGMIEYYRVIVEQGIDKNGYRRFWDASAQAPYLWNADSLIFISYEDVNSIKLKIEYLKEKGLGGVMFWEYTDDYQSQLLDAIYVNLN